MVLPVDNSAAPLTLARLADDMGVPRRALRGFHIPTGEPEDRVRVQAAFHALKATGVPTMTPLLPLFFNLNGEPYTLNDFFPFEPFFRTRMPRKSLFRTGRQVAKSASLSSHGVLLSNLNPWFKTLYVTPLFEMVRRLSQNYVKPFIENSPLRDMMISTKTINSVLQRTFLNGSQLLFSYAFTDATRIRGISAHRVVIDEIQDMDPNHLPVIYQVMGASPHGNLISMGGTPKSLDNLIEVEWQDSTQSEWLIPCQSCRYHNIPSLSHDLLKMIGPVHDNISPQHPAVVCAKCSRPVNPRHGRWIHAFPDRRWDSFGMHIPQIIMPMHYQSRDKWAALVAASEGKGNTPQHVFLNEVCGEGADAGHRLVTLSELKRAAVLPWENRLSEARRHLSSYLYRVLAVDWGGGGEDMKSFTVLSVLGLLPNGEVHVLWGYRSLRPHDHQYEAELCMRALSEFQCNVLAHDYSGAGSIRETFIAQSGWPSDRIVPIAYVRSGVSGIMNFKPATPVHPRNYYTLDKARSLLLTCQQIKLGKLKFFRYDYKGTEDEGLIHDFLGLMEDRVNSRAGADIYTITRDPRRSDDFAQAVNIGSAALYRLADAWPDLSGAAGLQLTPQQARAADLQTPDDWHRE